MVVKVRETANEHLELIFAGENCGGQSQTQGKHSKKYITDSTMEELPDFAEDGRTRASIESMEDGAL